MHLLPSLRLQFLNGWLLLAAYFLGLVLAVLTFPRDKRKKLFYEPSYCKPDPRRAILLLGRLAAVSFVGLMFFTPLRLGTSFFYVGLLLYALGYFAVMRSLLDYRHTAAAETVTKGLYRFSRNPQWVGLVLVFLGASVAVASWLHMALLAALVVAYHYQILLEEETCIRLYGESYLAYMGQVPRYLLLI